MRRRASLFLLAALGAASFGCGAIAPETASDAGSPAPGKTGATGTASQTSGIDITGGGGTITLPVGAYTGCNASIVNIAGNLTAVNGGNGTITISLDNGGFVTAALDFASNNIGDPSAAYTVGSGSIELVPTATNNTAATNGGSFTLQTVDATNANANLAVAAGTLSIANGTLFVSVHGTTPTSSQSAFFSCPVPTTLPSGTMAAHADVSFPAIPTGVYADCTAATKGVTSGDLSGGDLSLAVTRAADGTLTAREADGYPAICGGTSLAFDNAGNGAGSLSSGQTCALEMPCGPPPSLGISTAPDSATLGNMAGSIQFVAGMLFVNVAGDAPPGACGSHSISLVCPTTP